MGVPFRHPTAATMPPDGSIADTSGARRHRPAATLPLIVGPCAPLPARPITGPLGFAELRFDAGIKVRVTTPKTRRTRP